MALVTAVVGSLMLSGGTYVVAIRDRAADVANASLELERLSVVIAEQARQVIGAASLVLDTVADDARLADAQTPEEFRERLSTRDVHLRLVDRIRGVPQIDVASIIATDGTNFNFTREYPAPPIDLSDRDYFIAHVSGTAPSLFISAPVHNRGSGSWLFYLSRAIHNDRGETVGLVITGIRPDFFERNFEAVRISDRAAISLIRSDGILLARFPHVDSAMGRSFLGGAGFEVLRRYPEGGVIRTLAARVSDPSNREARITATRPVAGLPLVVVLSEPEDLILGGWLERTRLMAAGSSSAVVLLLVLGVITFRLFKSRERMMHDLEISKRAAENASSAKSRFLASMSHEIRTPMNAVLGLAGILLDSPINEEQRRNLRLMRDAGDNLLALLNDILDLSKLEASKVELEDIAFDPVRLTRDCADVLGPRASAKSLTLVVELTPDLPGAVRGDPSRIRQILFNLIGNAVKFTDRGTVRVSARIVAREEKDVTIGWSVTDTGIGIEESRIPALFDEFAQADLTITRRFGGTGLGLPICKRLVQLMNGGIAVRSAIGVGTTVEFELPLALTDAVEETTRPPSVDSGDLDAGLRRFARSARILLAEDNSTNQMVVTTILKHPMLHLDVVADGIEAIEAAARCDYDLILMDVAMPEMDGLAATRKIRARGGRYATIPIIGFTANAFSDDVAACRNAGMTDVITKPVRKEHMIHAVMRHLLGDDGLSPPADQGAKFNGDALRELADELGSEATGRVLRKFIDATSEDLERMAGMIGRPKDLHVLAHALKSSAKMVGADRLAQLAAVMEGKLDRAERVSAEEVAQLADAFREYSERKEVRSLVAG